MQHAPHSHTHPRAAALLHHLGYEAEECPRCPVADCGCAFAFDREDDVFAPTCEHEADLEECQGTACRGRGVVCPAEGVELCAECMSAAREAERPALTSVLVAVGVRMLASRLAGAAMKEVA